MQIVRRLVACALLSVLALGALPLLAPDAQAQVVDGDVSITASPGAGDTVQVRFLFDNPGLGATVTFDAVQLPVEVAATAQCRGVLGANVQNLAVAADGMVVLPNTTVALPPASAFAVECQFMLGDLCGLAATATATWSAPVGQRTVTERVTPQCPTADVRGRPFVLLDKEPSVVSTPLGTVVEWRITAHNIGSRRLNQVQIIDPLHLALDFVPASAGDGISYDEATRTVTARIGRLQVGESRTITFATRVNALSLIPNIATVTTGQGVWDTAESGVFGLPAEPTPTPEPQPDRTRTRDRDRGPRQALAHTGVETPLLAVIGVTLVAGGAMVVTAMRRDD